jgi:hypothetical protein
VILTPEGHVFIESKNIRKKTEIKALFYSTFDKNMEKNTFNTPCIHFTLSGECHTCCTR